MTSTATAWEEHTAIGRILLRRGVITERQLERAIARQQERAREGVYIQLGQVLLSLGIASASDIDTAVAEQRTLNAPPSNDGEVESACDALDRMIERSRKTTKTLRVFTDDMLRATEDTQPSVIPLRTSKA